jgi:hypothetical protein
VGLFGFSHPVFIVFVWRLLLETVGGVVFVVDVVF